MKRRDFINQSFCAAAVSAGVVPQMVYAATSLEETHGSPGPLIQHKREDYEVIVVGVGSMGSATCYYLAQQGVKVLGIEQFGVPHEHGSHAGQSRIIRKAYFEHPDYVPLLERAYQNWADLEEKTGEKFYYQTGLAYFGEAENPLMKGLRLSSQKYGIPLEVLSSARQKAEMPQFTIPEHFDRILEPDAGFVTPGRAIMTYTEEAIKAGGQIKTQEKTVSWSRDGSGFRVKTDKGDYTCQKLVLTAGAWTEDLAPLPQGNFKVTRQAIAWVKPKKWEDFTLGNFPCWVIADPHVPGIYYGFPLLSSAKFGGPIGLKLGHHTAGEATTAAQVDRQYRAEDEKNLMQATQKYLPQAFEVLHIMKTCLYTYTPDENFILDQYPGEDHVFIAAGFSGHGFKFASAIGEIMCDMAMKGKTDLPIGFLRSNRFG